MNFTKYLDYGTGGGEGGGAWEHRGVDDVEFLWYLAPHCCCLSVVHFMQSRLLRELPLIRSYMMDILL